MEDYFDIGRLLRPKGLDGEIWAEVWTDDPYRLAELDEFFVIRQGRRVRLEVQSAVIENGKLLLMFTGVASREQADELHGLVLQLHRRDLPPLGEDEFFLADLVGRRVLLEDGRPVGTVDDVLDMPASPVLVITCGDFEALVPAIRPFLVAVGAPGSDLVIQPLEGMIPDGMLERAAGDNRAC
jgi:16S rRNA processing protein RimM